MPVIILIALFNEEDKLLVYKLGLMPVTPPSYPLPALCAKIVALIHYNQRNVLSGDRRKTGKSITFFIENKLSEAALSKVWDAIFVQIHHALVQEVDSVLLLQRALMNYTAETVLCERLR